MTEKQILEKTSELISIGNRMSNILHNIIYHRNNPEVSKQISDYFYRNDIKKLLTDWDEVKNKLLGRENKE